MDLMDLRRGLMMQMASGARFVKGTITIPDSGNTYKIEFGKTFEKYLYYVEMTDESKTALMNSGINAVRAFGQIGICPNFEINNKISPNNSIYARYNPTADAASEGFMQLSAYDSDSITFSISAISTFATALFYGYTYNYFVVEIK